MSAALTRALSVRLCVAYLYIRPGKIGDSWPPLYPSLPVCNDGSYLGLLQHDLANWLCQHIESPRIITHVNADGMQDIPHIYSISAHVLYRSLRRRRVELKLTSYALWPFSSILSESSYGFRHGMPRFSLPISYLLHLRSAASVLGPQIVRKESNGIARRLTSLLQTSSTMPPARPPPCPSHGTPLRAACLYT